MHSSLSKQHQTDLLSFVPILVGPTAVGKTEVSLQLAERLDAEIISADSRQIYKYLDIGTAKPDPEALVRVPHHLIDTLELDEEYTAGRFASDARRCIEKIFARERTPLVVGGAGFYIKALLEGLFEAPARDEEVRDNLKQRVRKEGIEPLYEEFQEIDPEYAEQVHPNDIQKVLRALEIYQVTGEPPSDHHEKEQPALQYPWRLIGLRRDRQQLYERINRRVDQMISRGLVEEVQELLDQGYTGEENSLQTVGYQEIFASLQGEISLDEAVSEIKKHTRHYAKRQMTWFRNQHDVQWFQVEQYDTSATLVDSIEAYLFEQGRA